MKVADFFCLHCKESLYCALSCLTDLWSHFRFTEYVWPVLLLCIVSRKHTLHGLSLSFYSFSSPTENELKEQRAQVIEFSNSPQQSTAVSGTPPSQKNVDLSQREWMKRESFQDHICMQFTHGKECRGTPRTKFRLRRGLLLLWGDMTNRNTFCVILHICLNQPCYLWIQ